MQRIGCGRTHGAAILSTLDMRRNRIMKISHTYAIRHILARISTTFSFRIPSIFTSKWAIFEEIGFDTKTGYLANSLHATFFWSVLGRVFAQESKKTIELSLLSLHHTKAWRVCLSPAKITPKVYRFFTFVQHAPSQDTIEECSVLWFPQHSYTCDAGASQRTLYFDNRSIQILVDFPLDSTCPRQHSREAMRWPP